MREVFLDTVGLIALWDKRDQWHDDAFTAFQKILAEPTVAVTTDVVLLECGNALARMSCRTAVVQLRKQLMQANRLIVPDSTDLETAWKEFDTGTAGDAGIVDLISFQVMRRMNMSEAFTNDRHFKTAGFTTLF